MIEHYTLFITAFDLLLLLLDTASINVIPYNHPGQPRKLPVLVFISRCKNRLVLSLRRGRRVYLLYCGKSTTLTKKARDHSLGLGFRQPPLHPAGVCKISYELGHTCWYGSKYRLGMRRDAWRLPFHTNTIVKRPPHPRANECAFYDGHVNHFGPFSTESPIRGRLLIVAVVFLIFCK